MKKILLATTALAALAAPAFGADLGARPYYDKAPPAYAAPIYNWTGFYVGGHIGGAFSASNNFNGLVLSDNSGRLLGGVQVGGDWQFHPNFLIGVEGQYSWLGQNQLNAAFPADSSTTTTSAPSPRSPAASAGPGAPALSM
jgi:outer membrane immunogenic protein